MLSMYPACFFKDEDGYSVIFPDLNWLATCGDTLEEAMEMAVDCLAGYIFIEKRDHHELPKPSPVESIVPKEIAKELEPYDSYEEAFVNLVSVDVEAYAQKHFKKSVKKTLTIPYWLNEAAISAGLNFSQVLQEALMLKLGVL